MLAHIVLDWETRQTAEAFVDDDKKRLDEIFGGHSLYGSTLIDLSTDGRWLAEKGIGFTVKRFKGARYREDEKPTVLNPMSISIAIPDFGLLGINEVFVLEDACTNELQLNLNEGWRILCVCPPSGQRRPDYILGRAKPAK